MPEQKPSNPAEQPPARHRWLLLFFLGAMFGLAQPFDFAVSTDNEHDAEFNVASREEGNVARRIGLLGLVAFAASSALIHRRNQLRIRGIAGVSIIAFLCWAALSIGWSVEPAFTVRKVIVLGILWTSASAAARILTLDEILLLVLSSCGMALLLGILSELALGTFTPWIGSYRFAGVMIPAISAWTASLLFFAGLALRRRVKKGVWILNFICFGALLILLLTRTRAGVAAFAVALTVYGVLSWPPRRTAVAVVVGILVLAAAFLGVELSYVDSSGTLASIANLGRETESISNLTGRVDIWKDLAPFLSARPFIGYGYESFWSEQRLEAFASNQQWAVPDSHNGFIELTLGVGGIGAALYVVTLIAGIWTSWIETHRSQHPVFTVAICALVITIVNALFVATQLTPYTSTFVTLVLLSRVAFVTNPDTEAVSSADTSPGAPPQALVPA